MRMANGLSQCESAQERAFDSAPGQPIARKTDTRFFYPVTVIDG